MTTPWTIPRTWVDTEVVGAVTGNIHWRDNLTHLKAPPFAQFVTGITGQAIISTTASTAIPVATGVSATLTTYGGDINCFFQANYTGSTDAIFNLDFNGTAYTTLRSGLEKVDVAQKTLHYNVWITGLPSGLHTFTPTWRSPNALTIRIDASSQPIVFWVREG